MVEFRLSKYDPDFRTNTGVYTRSEWTSVSDIGKRSSDEDKVLTIATYLEVEDKFVCAISTFMRCLDLEFAVLSDLEECGSINSLPQPLLMDTSIRFSKLSDNSHLTVVDVQSIARLALREIVWCKLSGERDFYVHFGYDFYVYIGAECNPFLWTIPEGLFAEPFRSPYRK